MTWHPTSQNLKTLKMKNALKMILNLQQQNNQGLTTTL
jgi:hypothetical protein